MHTDQHYLWHLAGAKYDEEQLIYDPSGGNGWVDDWVYTSGHGGAYMHIKGRVDNTEVYRYGYSY